MGATKKMCGVFQNYIYLAMIILKNGSNYSRYELIFLEKLWHFFWKNLNVIRTFLNKLWRDKYNSGKPAHLFRSADYTRMVIIYYL